MAEFIEYASRTFGEYLLHPNEKDETNVPDKVSLKTSLVKHENDAESPLTIDIPLTSAIMQSVSGEKLAIALAQQGGIAFIYCSQPIEQQTAMVKAVKDKNLKVGAGINTHDYEIRIPQLVKAGADVLCIDSSDGHSKRQANVIEFVRKNFGNAVKIGAGNVITEDGFRYLADSGADFVKVGIGGGSICITREEKAIGQGQATAVRNVVAERNKYATEKGIYIPICSDGGIVYDNHLIMALAFGADFVMMGKYFARFKESPSELVVRSEQGFYIPIPSDGEIANDKRITKYKEYWGEGSARARNWQRYGSDGRQVFEEGVDAVVPYAGNLADGVALTKQKLVSTMCSLGAHNLKQFTRDARISRASISVEKESGSHGVDIRR